MAEGGILLFFCALGPLLVWKLGAPETAPPPPADARYQLTLVDVWGRRLSPATGPLKYFLSAETFARPAPNQHLPWLNTDEFGNRVTTGQPTGRPVAILLGGSTAFGYGTNSDDETIASRLQRIRPQWKWVNMAAPGFASGEELAQMVFNGDSLDPTIYVSLSGFNDYANGMSAGEGPFGRSNNFLMQTSDQLAAIMKEPGVGRKLSRPQDETQEVFGRRVSTFQRNILRMRDFAKARGARFLLALQPSTPACRAPASSTAKGCWPYVDRFIPPVIEFCRAKGIDCVDLNHPSHALPSNIFDGWIHLTPVGNEHVARAIAASL